MRIEKNLSTLNACLFSSASVLCIGVLMQTKNMCMYEYTVAEAFRNGVGLLAIALWRAGAPQAQGTAKKQTLKTEHEVFRCWKLKPTVFSWRFSSTLHVKSSCTQPHQLSSPKSEINSSICLAVGLSHVAGSRSQKQDSFWAAVEATDASSDPVCLTRTAAKVRRPVTQQNRKFCASGFIA